MKEDALRAALKQTGSDTPEMPALAREILIASLALRRRREARRQRWFFALILMCAGLLAGILALLRAPRWVPGLSMGLTVLLLPIAAYYLEEDHEYEA